MATTEKPPVPTRKLTPQERRLANREATRESMRAFIRAHSISAPRPQPAAQADHDRLAQATVNGILTPDGVPSKSPGQAMLRGRRGAAGLPESPSRRRRNRCLTDMEQARVDRAQVEAILDRVVAEEAAEAAQGKRPRRGRR